MAEKTKAAKVSKVPQVSKAKGKKTSSKEPASTHAKRGEPQSMDELLQAYAAGTFSLSVGDKVKGKIVKIEQGRVLVDIGGKAEGLIAEKVYKEAEELIKTLKVGDVINATVIVTETPDGYPILSLRDTVEQIAWEKINQAFEGGTPIEVEGKSVGGAGINVAIGNLAGFIPGSQLGKELYKNPQSLVGKKFAAVVIDLDRESKKIILSEKEISEKEELAKARDAVKLVTEGQIFDGEVTTIYDFGCFVKIDALISKAKKEKVPLEGLVHISELSWDKVKNPLDVVKEGQKVKVKVIGKRDGKLAFSIKQAQKDPWEDVEERYKKETKVKGKVVKISEYGAFVLLEPGIEGLLHITKIPPDKKLAEGQAVNVYVEEVDKKARKISLGLILTEKPVGYK